MLRVGQILHILQEKLIRAKTVSSSPQHSGACPIAGVGGGYKISARKKVLV
ncbi:hypothetical protein [Desulfosporosinus youngiae]|uniref:hypothetical protein n=1 Tax=Desulfosporosinus youngiae TaxID=339862 RepID=UPI00030B0913|nr:hypothetical protein [Desulfosporosinus youngiae]